MVGLATLQGVGKKIWGVASRIPGGIWVGVGAFLLLQLYIHDREQQAVLRAALQHWQDSVLTVTAQRQARADSLVARWRDSVATLQGALAEDTVQAAQSHARGEVVAGELVGVLHHAKILADTNTQLQLALTQIEAHVAALQATHAEEVADLHAALDHAAEIHATDRATVDSLQAALAEANRSIAAAIAKLDQVSRGPSLGHRLVREIPVALGGYVAGRVAKWP